MENRGNAKIESTTHGNIGTRWQIVFSLFLPITTPRCCFQGKKTKSKQTKITKKSPNQQKQIYKPTNKQTNKRLTKPNLKGKKKLKIRQIKSYTYSPNLNSEATSPFWKPPAAMIEQFLPQVVYCKFTFPPYLDSTNQLCFVAFSSSHSVSFLWYFSTDW